MKITLFDFVAEWCPPCRQMEPVLATIAKEYAGRVDIKTIDVEDERDLAAQYDVRAMPTFVIVRDGREVGRLVGARPRAFLAGMLDRALAGDVAITSP
jgi:thioredoxin 1